MEPAEKRLLAWQGPFEPCTTCGRGQNRRCISSSGTQVWPHKPRMDQVAGWLARQAEIDGLNRNLGDVDRQLEDALSEAAGHREHARVAEEARDIAQRRVAELEGSLRAALANWADVTGELGELAAEYAEHMTTHQRTLFGAGGGNKDRTKDGIDIDRWYGGQGDVDKAITRAKANHAAGIRTWLSFKLPFSWAEMAAGKGDAWVKALYSKLEALNFEVWVAFHHEPEGEQSPAAWRAMQDRLSRMVPSERIKFWLIVTGWHQEFSDAATWRWDALFPTGAPIHGIAYDQPYLKYGRHLKTGVFDDTWNEGSVYVLKLAARAKALGVRAGIAECGYSDEAFDKDPAWLDRFLAACQANGLEAVTYFDSVLNSAKSWTLGAADSAKRRHFTAAIETARA